MDQQRPWGLFQPDVLWYEPFTPFARSKTGKALKISKKASKTSNTSQIKHASSSTPIADKGSAAAKDPLPVSPWLLGL